MKNYQTPTLQIEEELAEGIFMASGDQPEEEPILRCSKGNMYFSINSRACRECLGIFG